MTTALLPKLFSSKARDAVLRVLLLDPVRAYYQRQVESATGVAIRGVQRELERLTECGLLYRREEGNRTYYQVDAQFPLYDELRSMVLKTSDPIDRFRGQLALEDGIRLGFISGDGARLLVVTAPGRRAALSPPEGLVLETMGSDEFMRLLSQDPESLRPFLGEGEDLLGRRDDVIWRHIESAGYAVTKRRGVP